MAEPSNNTTLVSAGAAGGGTALILLGVGVGLYFLTKEDPKPSTPESECREAAERWIPKCVIEKKKRRK